VLELQTYDEGRIEIEILEDHEILNTDDKDVLLMDISMGDGLRIENREDRGLIPEVVHKNSENGETIIENDKMDIVLVDDFMFLHLPEPLDLEGEDFEGKYQSVAMEIESDSLDIDTKLRMNSYRQFVVLSEDDEELVTYNRYDLPVSAKIEDNELQTIEQLREKYPEIEFEVPEYDCPDLYSAHLSKNDLSEKNFPPILAYITQVFFERIPKAMEDFSKIKYNNIYNAGVSSAFPTLIIGRKTIDPTSVEFQERPIRGKTNPMSTLRHEYTHRKDKIIEDEELLFLKSLNDPELNELIRQEEEIEVVDECDEFGIRNLREIRSKIRGIAQEKGYTLLQQEYNGLVRESVNRVFDPNIFNLRSSKKFKTSLSELLDGLDVEYAERIGERLTEEYGSERLMEIIKEEFEVEEEEVLENPLEFYERLAGRIVLPMQTNKLSYEDLSDDTKAFLFHYHMGLFSNDKLHLRLQHGQTHYHSEPAEEIFEIWEDTKEEELRDYSNRINELVKTHTGLRDTYVLKNYMPSAMRVVGGEADYSELPAVYREQSVEDRRILVQSGNRLIRNMNKKLTQFAFDSGKMGVEEFITIMGEGFCKEADCFDKLCVEYKLLCCEEHPSSVNC